MSVKRVLTVDELLKFVEEHKMYSFNSNEAGFELAVQMPGTFRFTKDSEGGDLKGLRAFKSWAFHDNVNLNRTNIETDTFKDKVSTAAFKPILAHIVTNESGEKDFGAHDFHKEVDENGKEKVIYEEQPVGTIDGSQTTVEYDEDAGVNRAVLSGYIFEEYCPDVIEIFERRGYDVDCSVELSIESFAYDAKKKAITFTDYYVSGLTLLGEDHNPGMAGSHLELVDFALNSEQYNDLLGKFNELLSKFENIQKGGSAVNKFEELLQKYGKTAEDITFEYENLSDEELEAKFAEAFETEPEQTTVEYSVTMGDVKRSFSLSLSDKRRAAYRLVSATYDDDWYDVEMFEDDGYLEMYGWFNGKNYRQKFTREGDTFALEGERVEVFAKYLTQEQLDQVTIKDAQFEAMKAENEELKQYKSNKEFEIAHEDKMSALVGYSSIENTDEYKSLLENIDKFSKEEVVEKADAIVGKYARQGMKLNFESTPTPAVRVRFGISDDSVTPENVKSYSGIFDD